ncbi:P-loop containing nucleoside triphosphate hydrolase protein [Lipomyces arxii]|uniref:P-loop containing nucleoside triphosphate hydrolase protein n=1 Tax=Lipomyces arxii TaxID=56418 RepID=UPI0034D011BC
MEPKRASRQQTWSFGPEDHVAQLKTKKRRKISESTPKYFLDRRKVFDEALNRDIYATVLRPPDFSSIPELEKPDLTEHTRPHFGQTGGAQIELPTGGVVPAAHAVYLRPYQVDGIKMMHEKFVYQTGMILGDDMGLGKTIQVIGALTAAFGKTADSRDRLRMRCVRTRDRWYPRVLIICTSSLIDNWVNELQTWGWWVFEIFHGAQKMSVLDTARQGRLEIMITTYKTYQLYESDVNLIEWDCVVADECHVIKESESEITKAMAKVNALCRIGLTGTAIQNAYEDMWTILNWANPGALGSKKLWIKTISKPLKAGQSHAATWDDLKLARMTASRLVTNVLPLFFLRRTKQLIADQLPKKCDLVVFCPMTRLQTEAYANYMSPTEISAFEASCGRCVCANKNQPDLGCRVCEIKKDDHFFRKCVNSLHIANHLAYLIPGNEATDQERERAMRVFSQCLPTEWNKYYKREPIINYSDPELCGKWKTLQNILKVWKREDAKVLIFSYSTKMLNMLTYLLVRDKSAYTYCRLDGKMKVDDRQNEVDRFNNDPNQFIFLLSIKAGGLGLNITSANKVVIWDPNWNPTYDLQAQDRAYRLGQRRDVEVYRLVSAGTIEEIVYARQIYKQQQANIGYTASNERRYFDGVMGESDKKGEIFGAKNMFKYTKDGTKLKGIVNKTNVAEALIAEVSGLRIEELDTQNVNETGPKLPDDLKHFAPDNDNNNATDPITAILNRAGVMYVHDNAQVVGPSKVEDEISRKAVSTAYSSDRPFGSYISTTSGLIYRPPNDVRARQFNSMAKFFKFKSTTVFALHVESMTQQQRRDLLDQFYASFPDL